MLLKNHKRFLHLGMRFTAFLMVLMMTTVQMNAQNNIAEVSTCAELKAALQNSAISTIVVAADINVPCEPAAASMTTTAALMIDRDLTLKGKNGHQYVIKRTGDASSTYNRSVLEVWGDGTYDGITVTLMDIIFDGGAVWASGSTPKTRWEEKGSDHRGKSAQNNGVSGRGVIDVAKKATLNLEAGVVVQNGDCTCNTLTRKELGSDGTTNTYGGGIRVNSIDQTCWGGTVNVKAGSTVQDCSGSGYGGGIGAYDCARLNVYGGTVCRCSSSTGGGIGVTWAAQTNDRNYSGVIALSGALISDCYAVTGAALDIEGNATKVTTDTYYQFSRIIGLTVSNCTATNGPAVALTEQGMMYIASSPAIKAENCTGTGNFTQYGYKAADGIYKESGTTTWELTNIRTVNFIVDEQSFGKINVEDGRSCGPMFPADPVSADKAFMEWRTNLADPATKIDKNTVITSDVTAYAKWYDHSHCICGDGKCTVPDHVHEIVGWKEWTSTTTLPNEAGNWYLANDVTITVAYQPVDGVNLCLNGHTVQTTVAGINMISISNGRNFALTDCQENVGKITTNNLNCGNNRAPINNAGTFKFYNGSVQDCATQDNSGGIRNTGTTYMYGGIVRKCVNYKNGTYARGGGVFSSGTFYMKGGIITECETKKWGGGFLNFGGTFHMSGGEISNNIGAGVYSGNLYLTGGIITGNSIYGVYARNANGWSCAITVGGDLKVVGNTGANVYLEGALAKVSTDVPFKEGANIGVTQSGTPTAAVPLAVTDNSGAVMAKYFTSDNPAYMAMNVGQPVKLVVPTCYYVKSDGNDANLGTVESPLATLAAAYNKIVAAGVPVGTIALLSDINAPAGAVQALTVSNSKTIMVTSAKANGDLLDNAEGDYTGVYRIKRGNNISTLVFLQGGNLTLEQIIFDGQAKSFRPTAADPIGMGGSGYFITASGSSEVLTLGRNAVLRDNINIDETNFNIAGSAVVLGNTSNGNATMYMCSNAKIVGCEAPRHGGALTIYKASCHMSDRSEMSYNGINYHSGNYYGGGAVLAYSGALYMSDDAVITKNFTQLNGNTVSKARSAVYLDNYGYVKDNARIFDNYDNGKLTRNNDGSYTLEGSKQANAYGAAGHFYVNGTMESNAMVGVTVKGTITAGSTVVATGSSYTVTADDADKFFDDTQTYKVGKHASNNQLVFVSAVTPVTLALGELTQTTLTATLSQSIALDESNFSVFKNGVKLESGYTVTVSGTTVTVTFNPTLPENNVTIGVSVAKNGYKVNNGEITYIGIHNHCICGDENCTGTGSGHQMISWNAWGSTTTLPTTAGNYYLCDNVTLTAAYQPVNGVNLCLNGHVVKQSALESVIIVNDNVNLTVTDCQHDAEHKYVVDANGVWQWNDAAAGGVAYESLAERPAQNTAIIVKGGAITGGQAQYYGGGIYYKKGNVTLNHVNIVGNKTREEQGAGGGGGLFNRSATSLVTLTLNATKVIGNYSADWGGGVHNETINSYNADNLRRIVMTNGAEISFNNAKNAGGAVYSYGYMDMESGSALRYNYATKRAGGVAFAGTAMSVVDSQIVGNSTGTTEGSASGGILMSRGNLTVGGTTVVKDNLFGTANVNVRLPNNMTITVSSTRPLTSDANIGVTTATAPTASAPVQITAKSDADYSAYFTADNANYKVENISNKVFLTNPNIVIAQDMTSSYQPTQAKNPSFDEEPWMDFKYNNTLYTYCHHTGGYNPDSKYVSNIVFHGVDEGWNQTATYAWQGNLFEYTDGVNHNYQHNKSINKTDKYIEMNNYAAAVFYQDITTHGNDIIRWSFKHGMTTNGNNEQPVRVEIGAPMRDANNNIINAEGEVGNGKTTPINTKIVDNTLAVFRFNGVTDKNNNTSTIGFAGVNIDKLKLTKPTHASGWHTADGIYIIPEGQTITRFAFVSEAAIANMGNLLDDLKFETLIGYLHANLDDYDNVVITGYWGDSDATKKLCVKVGTEVHQIDMSSVLNKNFKITFPKDKIGDATQVEIYHQDYEQAKRIVKIDPYKQVTNFDPKFQGGFQYTNGINPNLGTAVFTDNGQTVNGSTRAVTKGKPVTFKVPNGYRYYDGTTYDMYFKITSNIDMANPEWKFQNDGSFLTLAFSNNINKDFSMEMWLQNGSAVVDYIDVIGGSCYMGSGEGARPYSDDGYIYTNINNPASVWAWDAEKSAWYSTNTYVTNSPDKYILGHGMSVDHTLKGGYYGPGGAGGEFVFGYITKNVTFRAEYENGSAATAAVFTYPNPSTFSGNVLKVPVNKAIGTLPTMTLATKQVDYWYIGSDKETHYTNEQLSAVVVTADMTVTAVVKPSSFSLNIQKGCNNVTCGGAPFNGVVIPMTYGGSTSDVPVLEKAGAKFIGWSDMNYATTATYQTSDLNTICTQHGGTATIYPVWVINTGVPVNVALDNGSDIPAIGRKFTFNIDKVESTNPMPAVTTLTLDSPTAAGEANKVGYSASDAANPWRMDLAKGSYSYVLTQTNDAQEAETLDEGSWTMTFDIDPYLDTPKCDISFSQYKGKVDPMTLASFNIVKADNNVAANVTVDEQGRTRLVLGGNKVVNGDAFNTAVIKGKFEIDFDRNFVATGSLTPPPMATPDGTLVGFIANPTVPTSSNLIGGGNLGIIGSSVFSNGIVLEFDPHDNGSTFGDPGYAHFTLEKINNTTWPEPVKHKNVKSCWPSTACTYNIENDVANNRLVFRLTIPGQAEEVYTYDNPKSAFGTNVSKAYLIMSGVVRYGSSGSWGLGEKGTTAPSLEMYFNSFYYIGQKEGFVDQNIFVNKLDHIWQYTAEGNTLHAHCANDYSDATLTTHCALPGIKNVVVTATDRDYDGQQSTATITTDEWTPIGLKHTGIYYVGRDGTSYSSATAPANFGYYTACVSLKDEAKETVPTAKYDFKIRPQILCTSADPAHGSVTIKNGNGDLISSGSFVDPYENVTLTATAVEHWHFKNWTTISKYDNPDPVATWSFPMDASVRSHSAVFEIDKHTVTAMPNVATFGSVTIQNVTPKNGDGSVSVNFDYGSAVLLTAIPSDVRYTFLYWTKVADTTEVISTSKTYQFTLTNDTTFKAIFVDEVQVNIEATPMDGGQVAIKNNVTGQYLTPEEAKHILYGTSVTIEATCAEDYAFAGWYIKGTNTLFSKKQSMTFDATTLVLNLEARFTDAVIWVRVKK